MTGVGSRNLPATLMSGNKLMGSKSTTRSRQLRRDETRTEKLLWALLRARQVCDLKFRRQYCIGPFFADFACVEYKLVIEIDGGYHDFIAADDMSRERFLNAEGWDVLRVTVDQVIENPDGIGHLIAERLGLPYVMNKRLGREIDRRS